ncbi:1-deoxy-D-xylulose-5-phosphate synthase [Anaerolentibacter hominis]|uniref:1-deoxy-D-xylulose-5-phosphate synthase n=1 Tax=Anaerolentibacter hominis TaxID=3079009 RepID=UPI0031B89816
MSRILDKIEGPNDIKKLKPEEYDILAAQIREFLVEKVSRTGGHLASNLGVVELTMALHLCMDFPADKLIWDVGHQAYVHKILTGRKEEFDHLRQFGGMSGFPKMRESDCDAFDTGHSSTSISAALGMVAARELTGTDERIVAVIGDGALSGGMAYEALNNAARQDCGFVIVLNDNNMSISENVGGMSNYLGRIRTNTGYQNLKENVENTLNRIPRIGTKLTGYVRKSKDFIKKMVLSGVLFEDMGLTYIGPINGHDIRQMTEALEGAMKLKEPVIVHVVTQKGKGYPYAERNPSKFHGIAAFDKDTGKLKNRKKERSYTKVFSEHLIELAQQDERIVAVTAAMPGGTGLLPFQKQFPGRCFDVGIAEEHAVTFAAGMAARGIKPVAAVYSTFLQRAYDQLVHDVCLNNLPVFFAVDRAGIVGNDGETHQGVFDLSYLSSIPNMVVAAPKNEWEMRAMMDFGMAYDGPFALRYPRGGVYTGFAEFTEPVCLGRAEALRRESGVLLLALGTMVPEAEEVHAELKKHGIASSLVNMRFAKPFDRDLLKELLPSHRLVVTMEENVKNGSLGQRIGAWMAEEGYAVPHLEISVPDEYVVHGSREELLKKYKMDVQSVVERILRKMR